MKGTFQSLNRFCEVPPYTGITAIYYKKCHCPHENSYFASYIAKGGIKVQEKSANKRCTLMSDNDVKRKNTACISPGKNPQISNYSF